MHSRNNHEPQLCPNCPFKAWLQEAKKHLKERQYTIEKEEASNLKICLELRRIANENRLLASCPHYNYSF